MKHGGAILSPFIRHGGEQARFGGAEHILFIAVEHQVGRVATSRGGGEDFPLWRVNAKAGPVKMRFLYRLGQRQGEGAEGVKISHSGSLGGPRGHGKAGDFGRAIRPGHRRVYTAPMVDLRTLDMDARRALCAQAEQRARAGEAPVAIRAALGLERGTYARWAKLFGFRAGDLSPSIPQAGAALQHPPGPGGYARSGRFYRGEGLPEDHPARAHGAGHPGWTGGEAAARARHGRLRDGQRDAALQAVDGLKAADLLQTVTGALAAGELSEADRLLRAWRAQKRRAIALAALEAEAEGEHEAARRLHLMSDAWTPEDGLGDLTIAEMSDAQLRRYIVSLVPGLEG